MKKIQFQKLLKWQILLTIVFSLINLIFRHNLINLLYLALLLLAFFLIYKSKDNFSHLFNIIFLPYVFIHVYSDLIKLALKSITGFDAILFALYFIGMLALIIPVTRRDYGSLKKPIWQLIASIWIIINLFLMPRLATPGSLFIVGLNRSYLLAGLIFLEYAYFTVTGWGYKFHFNLKVKNKNLGYWLFLIVLLLVSLWLSYFNAFILSASDWSQALWNWDFSLLNPRDSASIKNLWQLYLSPLATGILEESARYIFLLTLLTAFTKKKAQAIYAILISSVIFSLLHILNFRTPGSSPSAVGFQILHAFGFGCLLAAILLYSGKLWLTMILHIFADFLMLSLVPLAYGGSLLANSSASVSALIIVTVIPLIFVAIILLLPASRKYINHNVENMLARAM